MIRDTSSQDIAVDPAPRRQRMKLAGAVAGAVLVLLAFAVPSLARWNAAERSVSGSTLRFSVVARGRFVSDVSVQGKVVAAVSPTLYAAAPGVVDTEVVAGDRVTKGQLLAVVDAPELRSEYQRELATLQSLQAAVERKRIENRAEHARNQQTVDLAKVTLDAAEREVERYRKSFEEGVISRQELERRQDELAEATVRYDHAVEDVALQDDRLAFELKTNELDASRQRTALTEVKRKVDELAVRSPVDGMVGSLAVQKRQSVAANAPLLTVVDLSAFEIELEVPESYADDITPDMAAEISYGGATYAGHVTAISPEVQNGEVTGRVRFDAQPADLRQNQRVSARIVLAEQDDALMVDRGPFLESGNGRVAYLVDDGIARRVPIEVGATSVGKVQIAQGLHEGQRIVISSYDPFERAASVLIRD